MQQALVFTHVPFEGPAAIRDWLTSKGITSNKLQCDDDIDWQSLILPDWLVIMGGPMSVNDTDSHPWLKSEIAFIRHAIDAGKKVLGICLGGQLIARALGANVTRNSQKEIGWFPVSATTEGSRHPLGKVFSASPSVLHWHGDTFAIPDGAVHLARSEACGNQAFAWQSNVLALQCHLEMGRKHVERLVESCASELAQGGPFIQPAGTILGADAPFEASSALLYEALDCFQAL
jgi:GMP synthase-like glutamine amidotransferase